MATEIPRDDALVCSRGSNIWIAASDGDLDRVKYLLDHAGMMPTSKDEAGYTPLHAAASYNKQDIMRYLLHSREEPKESINVEDNDGETPLFFCETVDMARLLVEELGADIAHRNEAGLSAAENARVNDLEDVAIYLASKTGESLASRASILERIGEEEEDLEFLAQGREENGLDDRNSESAIVTNDGNDDDVDDDPRVNALMSRIEDIMRRADESQTDPTEELRQIVSASIARQIVEGYGH